MHDPLAVAYKLFRAVDPAEGLAEEVHDTAPCGDEGRGRRTVPVRRPLQAALVLLISVMSGQPTHLL